MPVNIKPLVWIGGSKKDLLAMPEDVQDFFGFALHEAQAGKKSDHAKPLKGLVPPECWKYPRTGTETPIARSIR